jgi:hypothetical protein
MYEYQKRIYCYSNGVVNTISHMTEERSDFPLTQAVKGRFVYILGGYNSKNLKKCEFYDLVTKKCK